MAVRNKLIIINRIWAYVETQKANVNMQLQADMTTVYHYGMFVDHSRKILRYVRFLNVP